MQPVVIHPSTSRRQGIIWALLSGVFFGLLGYFGVRGMQAGLSVYTMLFWRYVVASLAMGLYLCVRKSALRENPRELFKVFIQGVFFYSGSSIFYFEACKTMGTGLSMMLLYTYPAMVMLINLIFQRQQPGKNCLLALGIMIPGLLALTIEPDLHVTTVGIVLGLLSAFSYTLYVIVSKNSRVNPATSTLMVSLGCMVTCYIGALADGTFQVPTGARLWADLVVLGVICTAFPIVLLLKSLIHLHALEVSILSVLEPVFILLFGLTLLHEHITITQGAGCFLLLSGALLTLREPERPINAGHRDCPYTPR